MPTVCVYALPRETRDELRKRAEIRGQTLGEYLTVHLVMHARAPDLDAPKTPRPNFGREMNRLYAKAFGVLILCMILLFAAVIAIDRLA